MGPFLRTIYKLLKGRKHTPFLSEDKANYTGRLCSFKFNKVKLIYIRRLKIDGNQCFKKTASWIKNALQH